MRNSVVFLITILFLAACASKPDRPPRSEQADRQLNPERIERQYSEYIARWDYNGDGQATCDDIHLLRSRIFRSIDADGDEVLSSGEFRHAKFEDKSFLFFDFTTTDENKSGKIDLDEFIMVTHSEFSGVDQNGDCILSRREALTALRNQNIGQGDQGRGQRGRGRGGRGGRSPRGG